MTTTADRGELRPRIVAAATRLFADHGFSATSVRQLCEACGCTKPALYYYFDSKERLFREVVQLHLDHLNDLVREWMTGAGSVRERLHEAVDAFIGYAAANPDVMRLLQRIELQPEDGAPELNIMATRECHMQMMSGLIERGIADRQIRGDLAPEDCALVLSGALSFQFEMALATGVWERDRIHRTIDLLFDGIAQ